jgi:hypothetical protein
VTTIGTTCDSGLGSSRRKKIMPLGEKLWEETSKAIGRRINDVSEKGVHEEVSFHGEIRGFGRLKGVVGRTVGTDNYWEKITCENVINGTANGVLTLGTDMVGFKAYGLGKLVKHSPLRPESLVSLIWFPDPPPSLAWMTTTIVIWEALVDPKNQTITATAYEWAGAKQGS